MGDYTGWSTRVATQVYAAAQNLPVSGASKPTGETKGSQVVRRDFPHTETKMANQIIRFENGRVQRSTLRTCVIGRSRRY